MDRSIRASGAAKARAKAWAIAWGLAAGLPVAWEQRVAERERQRDG